MPANICGMKHEMVKFHNRLFIAAKACARVLLFWERILRTYVSVPAELVLEWNANIGNLTDENESLPHQSMRILAFVFGLKLVKLGQNCFENLERHYGDQRFSRLLDVIFRLVGEKYLGLEIQASMASEEESHFRISTNRDERLQPVQPIDHRQLARQLSKCRVTNPSAPRSSWPALRSKTDLSHSGFVLGPATPSDTTQSVDIGVKPVSVSRCLAWFNSRASQCVHDYVSSMAFSTISTQLYLKNKRSIYGRWEALCEGQMK